MRINGDAGNAGGGGHVAQMLAEAHLVDGELGIDGSNTAGITPCGR
jgi:hypothetical protein